MHNIRRKIYHDNSEQITYYSKPIQAEHNRFDCNTGEIFNVRRSDCMESIENPFTGELERVKVLKDSKKKDYDNYNRAKNKIYDIARCNDWEWFVTFTFSSNYVDRYDYAKCKAKISKWLNNVRSKGICSDMKYLIVPEQHKDGAWHFHGLFSNCSSLGFVDSGIRDKKGRVIYNIGRYKWGFTTATKVTDSKKSAGYLCKYITKELVADTKGQKRYWHSKNCDLPVVVDEFVEISVTDYCNNLSQIVPILHIKEVITPYNKVSYIEVGCYDCKGNV